MSSFIEYIGEKIRVNELLYKKYEAKIFRQYKFYSYINTKRTESKMLNIIEKEYGKDQIIIIGDWSISKQMRNFISTPNIGLKRKLKERFKVYNIDEFRTSCLNHKTENKCENMYLPDKKGTERKIHSILTYQTESKRMGCVNRDENAVNNMIKIVNTFIKDKTRPERFRRDFKFPEEQEIKDNSQPIKDTKIKKLVKKKITKDVQVDIPAKSNQQSSLMKIQSYERLVIFAERIGFKSLIDRISSDILNAKELGIVFTEAIRNEFDHNLSQQIYISEKAWQAIVDLKDQQIFIINLLVSTLPPEASGKELSEAMLSLLKADENASMQTTVLEALRFEARQILATT
jgi:hypothetical protein